MDDSQMKIGEPDKTLHPNVELNYYYSREKRLENAPSRIKDMYSPPRKTGFLRSLTDTPPKLMLLITIGVLCVVIAVLTYAMN
ncbi:MAG: hypothetical protein LBK61_06230 [Spirochaetaceae bacterium]|jgi:hypothetical protein|nr:hypothetical protein [Spirochaetaceae bacterium]